MSTPEQPETPPLTRKQLREIRNTGATPVIDVDSPTDTSPSEQDDAVEAPAAPPPPPPALPLARAAEPVVLPEPPGPDAEVDLGVSPLTRRQARQQERIRTASVPVITPEAAAAYAAAHETAEESDAASPPAEDHSDEQSPFEQLGVFAVAGKTDGDAEEVEDEAQDETADASGEAETASDDQPDIFTELHDDESDASHDDHEPVEADEPAERAIVNPGFGAGLLAGAAIAGEPPRPDLSPSFDELITRSSNGSVATPNALILSQVPDGGQMMAPLTATGEVLITGTLNLPEGLGSTGHAPGAADGKEADAVLIDGELPAHSSPTPIAASAAISTVKTPGEIIKPPAPEKGGKLMLTLAITAGVLALALVGVLILAFATGVF